MAAVLAIGWQFFDRSPDDPAFDPARLSGAPRRRIDPLLAATLAVAIAAIFQLADGAQAVAAGVLRGVQDTRVPMVIALIGYWAVGFTVSVVLGFWTPLAGVGVWIGLAFGLLVVALLLVDRWRRRERLGLVRPV